MTKYGHLQAFEDARGVHFTSKITYSKSTKSVDVYFHTTPPKELIGLEIAVDISQAHASHCERVYEFESSKAALLLRLRSLLETVLNFFSQALQSCLLMKLDCC
jgi:hypothetical protein